MKGNDIVINKQKYQQVIIRDENSIFFKKEKTPISPSQCNRFEHIGSNLKQFISANFGQKRGNPLKRGRFSSLNNIHLDLVNMNADIFNLFSGYREETNFGVKGQNSGTNVRKMACNNQKLGLANMDAYIKFGEILSIGSQDIERKQNFGANQGP